MTVVAIREYHDGETGGEPPPVLPLLSGDRLLPQMPKNIFFLLRDKPLRTKYTHVKTLSSRYVQHLSNLTTVRGFDLPQPSIYSRYFLIHN